MVLRLMLGLCLVVLIPFAVGCGDDEETEQPTTVSAADLEEDGDFWNSLTPDLKDELVEIGQQRLGEERPDGASVIDAMDTSALVDEIDKQYANEAKRDESIYETYRAANDTLAGRQFEELVPELEGQNAP